MGVRRGETFTGRWKVAKPRFISPPSLFGAEKDVQIMAELASTSAKTDWWFSPTIFSSAQQLGKSLLREETLGDHYGLLLLVWVSPLRQPGATEETNEWKHWASGTASLGLIKDWDVIKSGTDLDKGSELKEGRERETWFGIKYGN